jgi:thioredoxin-related protein
MMKKEVFPSSEVKKFHDRFVWAYLDMDEESNAAAVEKFGVNIIPHIEFLNMKGKRAHQELGAPQSEQFVSILKQVLKKTGGSEKAASPAAAATAKNK